MLITWSRMSQRLEMSIMLATLTFQRVNQPQTSLFLMSTKESLCLFQDKVLLIKMQLQCSKDVPANGVQVGILIRIQIQPHKSL